MILALALLILAPQEHVEKARKLIDEAAAKLKGAPAVYFEQENTQGEAGSPDARVPTRSKVTFKLPDKMRSESTGSSGTWLQLFDGKTMWSYEQPKNEYTRYPQYRGTIKTRGHDNPLIKFCLDSEPAKILDKATDVVVEQRKEGESVFDVISWRGKDNYSRAPITDFSLWLDASRLPRRFTRTSEWQGRLNEQAVEYTKVDLAPKVAEDAFTFKIPEGAVEKAPFVPGGGGTETEGMKQAKKLLIEVHNAFAATDALTYEMELISEVTGEAPTPPHRTVTTLKRPDFIRQVSKSEYGDYMYLSDGEFMWTVMPEGKNFTKRELTTAGHRLLAGIDPLIHVFFEGERPETLNHVQDVSVSQDTLDGEKCDIIEWSYPQPEYKMKYKFWLDSARRPRLNSYESEIKGKTYKTSVKYTSYDLKPAIPKDHFTFKPGAEWTDRSNEQMGEKLISAGKKAPDFEAYDADGKGVKLSSFKGSPVLIVFGYFRHPSEFTRIKEFQEEFSKSGVTVLAVGVGPEGSKPDPKKESVRILRLKDKAALKAYAQDYQPGAMYLLDGDMNVLESSFANDAIKKAINEKVGPTK
ncbi:MAG TPA: DUF2092 domain-containing protein [Planctomycetota bacterium]|nr:DUF2092 domain-containing protein [Planctomycetota bacterium]